MGPRQRRLESPHDQAVVEVADGISVLVWRVWTDPEKSAAGSRGGAMRSLGGLLHLIRRIFRTTLREDQVHEGPGGSEQE